MSDNVTKQIDVISKSDINKLHAFTDSPESYAFSEKGREKVEYLLSVRKHFNSEQESLFAAAIAKWKDKLEL